MVWESNSDQIETHASQWGFIPTLRSPYCIVLYIQYRGTILPPRAGRRWRGDPLDLEISSSRRAHRLRVLSLPPLAFQTVESGGGDEQRGRHEGQKMDAAHSSSLNTSLETPSQAKFAAVFSTWQGSVPMSRRHRLALPANQRDLTWLRNYSTVTG